MVAFIHRNKDSGVMFLRYTCCKFVFDITALNWFLGRSAEKTLTETTTSVRSMTSKENKTDKPNKLSRTLETIQSYFNAKNPVTENLKAVCSHRQIEALDTFLIQLQLVLSEYRVDMFGGDETELSYRVRSTLMLILNHVQDFLALLTSVDNKMRELVYDRLFRSHLTVGSPSLLVQIQCFLEEWILYPSVLHTAMFRLLYTLLEMERFQSEVFSFFHEILLTTRLTPTIGLLGTTLKHMQIATWLYAQGKNHPVRFLTNNQRKIVGLGPGLDHEVKKANQSNKNNNEWIETEVDATSAADFRNAGERKTMTLSNALWVFWPTSFLFGILWSRETTSTYTPASSKLNASQNKEILQQVLTHMDMLFYLLCFHTHPGLLATICKVCIVIFERIDLIEDSKERSAQLQSVVSAWFKPISLPDSSSSSSSSSTPFEALLILQGVSDANLSGYSTECLHKLLYTTTVGPHLKSNDGLTRPSSCGPQGEPLLTEQSSVGPHNDMALLTKQSSVPHGTKVRLSASLNRAFEQWVLSLRHIRRSTHPRMFLTSHHYEQGANLLSLSYRSLYGLVANDRNFAVLFLEQTFDPFWTHILRGILRESKLVHIDRWTWLVIEAVDLVNDCLFYSRHHRQVLCRWLSKHLHNVICALIFVLAAIVRPNSKRQTALLCLKNASQNKTWNSKPCNRWFSRDKHDLNLFIENTLATLQLIVVYGPSCINKNNPVAAEVMIQKHDSTSCLLEYQFARKPSIQAKARDLVSRIFAFFH
jgi:hypothetical protein